MSSCVYTRQIFGPYSALLMAIALSLASCSDNPAVRIRYDLEKQSFAAGRLARDLRHDPNANAVAQLNELRDEYAPLVDRCYAALDSIDPETYPEEYREIEQLTFQNVSQLERYLFALRQFDTCVALLNQAIKRIRLPAPEAMLVHFSLGRALQANGQWDSCQAVYDFAVTEFYPPLNRQGQPARGIFNLPLHLYWVTRQVGNEPGASDRFALAQEYYQRVLTDFPNTILSMLAHSSLSRLYELDGQFELAIEHAGKLTDSAGVVPPVAKMRMAGLYANRMNRPDEALALYDQVESDLSPDDSLTAAALMFRRAQALAAQQKPREARLELIRLEDSYPGYFRGLPSAQLLKAQTFEAEGNWERAETEYRFLVDEYQLSNEAMSTYLYLARHYSRNNRESMAQQWLDRAAEFYDQTALQARGDRVAAALSYKAELLTMREDWPAAADALVSIFERFPATEVGRRAVLTAAQICREQLEQVSRADSLVALLRSSLTEVDDATGN
ncbi:MAG: hypothetical protein JSU65_08665 [Candidatus Zixiibacteriota bacterium]|nr:MAG: hypothetical protein JSU65_08665 [candidate division Zixibacteria bacterium]